MHYVHTDQRLDDGHTRVRRRARLRRSLASFFIAALALTVMAVLVVPVPKAAEAQSSNDTTMLLFDLSGSMRGTRLESAKSAVIDALSNVGPRPIDVGIRSFAGCGGTTLNHPPRLIDVASLTTTINGLQARGSTDIATALLAVGGDFTNAGPRTVILLSDGAQTCSGDPCAAAAQLVASGVNIVVNTVGIGTAGTTAESQLNCISQQTGGVSVSVDNAGDLFGIFDPFIGGGGTFSEHGREPLCINTPFVQSNDALANLGVGSVSYTHLTLPTICSV